MDEALVWDSDLGLLSGLATGFSYNFMQTIFSLWASFPHQQTRHTTTSFAFSISVVRSSGWAASQFCLTFEWHGWSQVTTMSGTYASVLRVLCSLQYAGGEDTLMGSRRYRVKVCLSERGQKSGCLAPCLAP